MREGGSDIVNLLVEEVGEAGLSGLMEVVGGGGGGWRRDENVSKSFLGLEAQA